MASTGLRLVDGAWLVQAAASVPAVTRSASLGVCSAALAAAAASAVQTALFIGIYLLLGARDLGTSWQRVAVQAAANALIGLLAFRVADSLPGAVERRNAGPRMRR
mgnify:CR=1 FL=1